MPGVETLYLWALGLKPQPMEQELLSTIHYQCAGVETPAYGTGATFNYSLSMCRG